MLIPIRPNNKIPDVPQGQSWKNPQYHLTPQQAITRLKQGGNIGIIAHDWLCIVDLDDPAKYTLEKPTLTITTRSGALHKYYLNDGTIENSVGKNSLAKCGEVRAEWQYVLAPGSYVPPENNTGTGLYHITTNTPPATLCKHDLPTDFIPTEKTIIAINPEILNTPLSIRNHKGTSLETYRKRDPKLDSLLNGHDLTGDTSRDDASTLNHLINDCEFTDAEAITILKKYRYRPKLERPDYLQHTLNNITRRPPNPLYQLNLQTKPTTTITIKDTNTQQQQKPKTTQENQPLKPIDYLIKKIKQENPTFLTDQYNNPYIHIKQTSNNQTYHATIPINSREFKNYASYTLYQNREQTIPNETLTTLTNTINGICQHEGKQHHLYNRVAQHDKNIYLDLANQTWQTIKITPNGWTIENNPPILFRRYKHQKPLQTPTQQTSLEEARVNIQKIFNHLNITPENYLIFLTTIISYLIPNIPHPILIIHGPQGSAKSTIYRFIKRLIDPSYIELLTLPTKTDETIQQLNHHWLTFYDNITYITEETSDIFCRAVTGAGFSKRELYTNDDDIIYNIKRCIGLNGINQVAKKSDLLDRAILVETQPIVQRKTEIDIENAYEQDHPIILSAILTILSETIKIQSTIKLDNYQRLADYHHWGAAITQALGHTIEDFNSAYTDKIETQTDEVIDNDPLALAFLTYFENYFTLEKQQYKGTATELLHQLTQTAETIQIKTNQKNMWPQDAPRFKRQLNALKPALIKKGYTVEDGKSNGLRCLFIYKTQQTQISTYTDSPAGSVGSVGSVILETIYPKTFENIDIDIDIEGKVSRITDFTDPTDPVHSVLQSQFIPKSSVVLSGEGQVYVPMTCGQCICYCTVDCVLPEDKKYVNGFGAMHCFGCLSFKQKVSDKTLQSIASRVVGVCYFCGGSGGDDWMWGSLSFDNPAHVTCYRLEEEKQKNKITNEMEKESENKL
jgi:hypothetical protein